MRAGRTTATTPGLVLRTANCPASLAGCSLAYQARLPRVEPAAYVLRTGLSVKSLDELAPARLGLAELIGKVESNPI